MIKPMWRVGIGQDSHRLIEAETTEKLYLAGLPFECGLTFAANSDGDVILHALCNALSTAIGGGSLSQVADELCAQGITDSREYVKVFWQNMTTANYQIANVSISIEALQPKLEKYRELMQKSLAKILQIETSQIGIAFTTGEGLSECGQGKGISATVTILLQHQ